MLSFIHRVQRWGVALATTLMLSAATVAAEGPPEPSEPSAEKADGDVASYHTKANIREVVQSHHDEVKDCWKARLATKPNLLGRVLVRFTIGPTGHVVAAIVESSTVNDRQLEECLVTVVKTLRFPAGRIVTTVTYPYVLIAASSETPSAAATRPAAGGTEPKPAPQPDPKVVRSTLIEKDRLTEVVPHLPDAVKREHCGKTLHSSYKLCVALNGTINSVSIIDPVPGANYAIIDALYRWKYKPQPVPVCFVQHFAHELAPCPPKQPAAALGISK